MKCMNKFILVVCVMTVSMAKAQIISGGLFRNQMLNSNMGNISSQGFEVSTTHYFFTLNAGIGFGKTDKIKMNTTQFGIDFTPFGFHHAYYRHKFSPSIGFQVNSNRLEKLYATNFELPQNTFTKNTKCDLSLGFKLSHNRVIGSANYLMGQQESSLTVRLAYIIAVTHKCLKKHLVPLELGF